MDHAAEELKKDKKKLIEILEELLNEYICMSLATKYQKKVNVVYVASILNDMKKKALK
jgi:hypothetical protein